VRQTDVSLRVMGHSDVVFFGGMHLRFVFFRTVPLLAKNKGSGGSQHKDFNRYSFTFTGVREKINQNGSL
jgi:hypothetical protein